MSFRPESGRQSAALRGTQGELVVVRVRVDQRMLEDLLEALAGADFPINPEIRHGHPNTTVEFPAYDTQIDEIRRLMAGVGLVRADLEVASMLGAIA